MKSKIEEDVQDAIVQYPGEAKRFFRQVRKLIMQAARESVGVENVVETLKWGMPSYLAKPGSTIRMAWSKSRPEHFYLYFHCQSILVETFRELFGDALVFEKNRAIVFRLDEAVPEELITKCFTLAMQYHRIKHLPLLGV